MKWMGMVIWIWGDYNIFWLKLFVVEDAGDDLELDDA